MFFFFFFMNTATTEIYTLSLHDALPIFVATAWLLSFAPSLTTTSIVRAVVSGFSLVRSEEHTSELQSRSDLVCRLLLEKKKKKQIAIDRHTPDRKSKSLSAQIQTFLVRS